MECESEKDLKHLSIWSSYGETIVAKIIMRKSCMKYRLHLQSKHEENIKIQYTEKKILQYKWENHFKYLSIW